MNTHHIDYIFDDMINNIDIIKLSTFKIKTEKNIQL